jgi:hypothetical protein
VAEDLLGIDELIDPSALEPGIPMKRSAKTRTREKSVSKTRRPSRRSPATERRRGA